ncbi:MAG: hypothetical protein AAGI24_11425 [Pseudomonadota bacterium]
MNTALAGSALSQFRAAKQACISLLICWLLCGCDPVQPIVEFEHWEFEGFKVYSYIPEAPAGLVYFFHGSGGSAEFALRVETVDLINILIERGYGFVATESTQRTAPRRWQVTDSSLQTNADLARLTRLQEAMRINTAVSAETPLFGVGMSNGARMVSLFAQSLHDAGYPVSAIAVVMGTVASPVTNAGGLTVPALFIVAENDLIVSNEQIFADHLQVEANQLASDYLVKREEPILGWRFTRIPSIDETEALAIVQAAHEAGIWNENGVRQLPIEDTVGLLANAPLPDEVSGDLQEVLAQFSNILAVHQFTALFREHIADFFDRAI